MPADPTSMMRDLRRKIDKTKPILALMDRGELRVLSDEQQRLVDQYPRWLFELEELKAGRMPVPVSAASATTAAAVGSAVEEQEGEEDVSISAPAAATKAAPPANHNKQTKKASGGGAAPPAAAAAAARPTAEEGEGTTSAACVIQEGSEVHIPDDVLVMLTDISMQLQDLQSGGGAANPNGVESSPSPPGAATTTTARAVAKKRKQLFDSVVIASVDRHAVDAAAAEVDQVTELKRNITTGVIQRPSKAQMNRMQQLEMLRKILRVEQEKNKLKEELVRAALQTAVTVEMQRRSGQQQQLQVEKELAEKKRKEEEEEEQRRLEAEAQEKEMEDAAAAASAAAAEKAAAEAAAAEAAAAAAAQDEKQDDEVDDTVAEEPKEEEDEAVVTPPPPPPAAAAAKKVTEAVPVSDSSSSDDDDDDDDDAAAAGGDNDDDDEGGFFGFDAVFSVEAQKKSEKKQKKEAAAAAAAAVVAAAAAAAADATEVEKDQTEDAEEGNGDAAAAAAATKPKEINWSEVKIQRFAPRLRFAAAALPAPDSSSSLEGATTTNTTNNNTATRSPTTNGAPTSDRRGRGREASPVARRGGDRSASPRGGAASAAAAVPQPLHNNGFLLFDLAAPAPSPLSSSAAPTPTPSAKPQAAAAKQKGSAAATEGKQGKGGNTTTSKAAESSTSAILTTVRRFAVARAAKDFAACVAARHALPSITELSLVQDNVLLWSVHVSPLSGPFAGSAIPLQIVFPDMYPVEAPTVYALVSLPHPLFGLSPNGTKNMLCIEWLSTTDAPQAGSGRAWAGVGWGPQHSALSVLMQLEAYFVEDAFDKAKSVLNRNSTGTAAANSETPPTTAESTNNESVAEPPKTSSSSSSGGGAFQAFVKSGRLDIQQRHAARANGATFNGPLIALSRGTVLPSNSTREVVAVPPSGVLQAPLSAVWAHGYTWQSSSSSSSSSSRRPVIQFSETLFSNWTTNNTKGSTPSSWGLGCVLVTRALSQSTDDENSNNTANATSSEINGEKHSSKSSSAIVPLVFEFSITMSSTDGAWRIHPSSSSLEKAEQREETQEEEKTTTSVPLRGAPASAVLEVDPAQNRITLTVRAEDGTVVGESALEVSPTAIEGKEVVVRPLVRLTGTAGATVRFPLEAASSSSSSAATPSRSTCSSTSTSSKGTKEEESSSSSSSWTCAVSHEPFPPLNGAAKAATAVTEAVLGLPITVRRRAANFYPTEVSLRLRRSTASTTCSFDLVSLGAVEHFQKTVGVYGDRIDGVLPLLPPLSSTASSSSSTPVHEVVLAEARRAMTKLCRNPAASTSYTPPFRLCYAVAVLSAALQSLAPSTGAWLAAASSSSAAAASSSKRKTNPQSTQNAVNEELAKHLVALWLALISTSSSSTTVDAEMDSVFASWKANATLPMVLSLLLLQQAAASSSSSNSSLSDEQVEERGRLVKALVQSATKLSGKLHSSDERGNPLASWVGIAFGESVVAAVVDSLRQ